MVNNSGSTGTGPKVFLNYLSFDAGYVAITDPSQTNFIRITTAAKETGGDIVHERMYAQVVVKQAGYMYIYYSNEDATGNYEAYFDDFTVTHTKFKVYKAEDYYPFGLAMDGNTYTDPYRYGYQGQYSEKDATTGLNEFELRMYDARFGRWISPDPYGQFASPYIGMGNAPHMGVDPDGGYVSGWIPAFTGALVGGVIGGLVGLAVDKENWYWYALGGAAAGAIGGQWYKNNKMTNMGGYQGKYNQFGRHLSEAVPSAPPSISKITIPSVPTSQINLLKVIPPPIIMRSILVYQGNSVQPNIGTLSWIDVDNFNRENIVDVFDANSGGRTSRPIPEAEDWRVNHYRNRGPGPDYNPAMTVNDIGFSYDIIPDRFGRSLLRIHPDAPPPGTDGCIGLTGNDNQLVDFRTRMNGYLQRRPYVTLRVRGTYTP
jgi:RHS repeat-associated protein